MLTHIENGGKEYSQINLVMSTIQIKTTTMKSSRTDNWQHFYQMKLYHFLRCVQLLRFDKIYYIFTDKLIAVCSRDMLL